MPERDLPRRGASRPAAHAAARLARALNRARLAVPEANTELRGALADASQAAKDLAVAIAEAP